MVAEEICAIEQETKDNGQVASPLQCIVLFFQRPYERIREVGCYELQDSSTECLGVGSRGRSYLPLPQTTVYLKAMVNEVSHDNR